MDVKRIWFRQEDSRQCLEEGHAECIHSARINRRELLVEMHIFFLEKCKIWKSVKDQEFKDLLVDCKNQYLYADIGERGLNSLRN